MKKKTFNRVFAMFSAVLMLVGMFPSVPATVIAAETTGSEGTTVAKKAYVMDAADLKAEQFGEDGKLAAATGDIKVGTDDYFTVGATGSKNSLKQLAVSVTVPEKLINTDSTKTREYSIVRLHNGVAEVLEGAKTETVDGKLVISFSTDKFSTYVIVYKDTVNGNPGSDDGNKGDNKGDDNTPSTPDKPTEPTKPEEPVKPTNPTEPVTPTEPSTGDVTGNTDAATDNGAASNTDSTTAAATESGESTATGDMAHTAVYAVLAMVAAGLALAVVVYDNKKKRI